MNPMLLKFKQPGQSRSDNWTLLATDGHQRASLCAEGFSDYIDLPAGVHEFTAELTEHEPLGSDASFKIVRNPSEDGGGFTLDTEENMGLYGSALTVLAEAHSQGYRWLRVSY